MKHEEKRHKNHKFHVLRFMFEYTHTEYGTGCTAEERNDKQRFFRGAPFFIDCSFFIAKPTIDIMTMKITIIIL